MPYGWYIILTQVISLNGNDFPVSANVVIYHVLPVSMIGFSNIIMLIHQYRKNQPINRYRDSSCWFANIGQLGHLPITENRISEIRKYNLHFTEMDKQSCAHTTVSSPWPQFLDIQLKTFGENILKAPRCNLWIAPPNKSHHLSLVFHELFSGTGMLEFRFMW